MGMDGHTLLVRIALICAADKEGLFCRKAGAEKICRKAAATSCGERFSTDILKCVVQVTKSHAAISDVLTACAHQSAGAGTALSSGQVQLDDVQCNSATLESAPVSCLQSTPVPCWTTSSALCKVRRWHSAKCAGIVLQVHRCRAAKCAGAKLQVQVQSHM